MYMFDSAWVILTEVAVILFTLKTLYDNHLEQQKKKQVVVEVVDENAEAVRTAVSSRSFGRLAHASKSLCRTAVTKSLVQVNENPLAVEEEESGLDGSGLTISPIKRAVSIHEVTSEVRERSILNTEIH